MAVELKVPIVFDAQGQANIKTAFADAEKSASSLSAKMTALSTTFLALKEAFSLGVEIVKKLAEASLAYESANQKLKTTLEVMGQPVKDGIEGIRKFAEQMQNASGVSSDLIVSVTASNIALGMTASQAEATAQAALGLAKAQGIDLTQANNELIQSLNGQVRSLRQASSEIAGMNKVQLAHGAAIAAVGAQYNKFITSDMSTTQGVLDRLKVGWEDLTKAIGIDFFQGLDLPGHFQEINTIIQEMLKTVEDNKNLFIEFGQILATGFMTSLKGVASIFSTLAPYIGNVTSSIIGLVQAAIMPFIQAIDYVVLAYQKVQSLITGDKSGVTAARAQLDQDFKNWSAGVDRFSSGLSGVVGTATSSSSVSTAAPIVTAPKPRSANLSDLPLNKQLVQEQANFAKQIQTEQIDIAAIGTDQLTAEYLRRIDKLDQLQKDAALHGFDYSVEVQGLKDALDDKYVLKFQQDETAKRLYAAQASGNTLEVIERQYQQEVEAYKEKLRNMALSQAEYDAAVAESQRKAKLASMQTTGSTSVDQMLNTATSFVGSIQGGLNSMIGQIGHMFGPEGDLIAGVIQLLNQTPEQFHKMVQTLIQAMEDLPKFLAANIPYLLTQIPEIMASAVRTTFSVPFWVELVKNLWVALTDMFKNFWALIFGGDQIGAAMNNAQSAKPISFGANDPNAGNSEFKIKTLNGQVQQATTFQDTFTATVDSSSKSFTSYLMDAWKSILKLLDDWFVALPGKIIQGLSDLEAKLQLFKGWGENIITGFLGKIPIIGPALSALGGGIWNSFMDALNKNIDAIKQIVSGNIWAGIKEFFGADLVFWRNIGGYIWQAWKDSILLQLDIYKTVGLAIWAPLRDAFLGAGDILSDMGKNIWASLKGAMQNAGAVLGNMGTAIYDGLKTSLNGMASFLGSMGGSIVQGIVDGLISIKDWLVNFFGSLIPGASGGGGFIGNAVSGVENFIHHLNRGGPITSSMASPALASAMSAMGALHFADGGMVPGAGFRDTVPAIVTPGEQVLSRSQAAAYNKGGSTVINLSFNVAAGAIFDKTAVKQAMPQIIDALRRESKNGTLIVRANGVY